ncbi:hypothetical protein Ciccas_003940 [Cichlidogyrus casuarinus]|uniref:VWFD domain-containing protein n=1 Tax=Cichlidogyrus casuarinus TaxID=1844966 RepID=A0ABD2QDU4_9PLAT
MKSSVRTGKLLLSFLVIVGFQIANLHAETCPRAKVVKGECIRGERLEHITWYAQNAYGTCVEKNQTQSKPCSILPGENFCQCAIVGDPHYRTFNGHMIHFFGNCTYSLAESKETHGECAFKIRGKNEHRHGNLRVSYLRYITVEMADKKITLHQFGRVFIDGVIASLPVEVNKDIQIFHSGTMVDLVSKKCGVVVSFDGNSNGYVMVSKDYRGKITKQGVDVSGKPDKFNLIGNSYSIESTLDGAHACKPAQPLPQNFCTNDQEEKLVKPTTQCGALLDAAGPFSACLDKVNAEQLYESCKIDICANANNAEALTRARCELFKAMEEQCSMKGISGLQWRAALNCPLQCGKNKVYSAKMDPCPKTCENHFFGTRKQCYDLPSQEGCECKPGYILDGMLCVKPSQCQCLEGCRDTGSKSDCKTWVAEGKCTKFPRLMKHVCRASCKFCVEEVTDVCVDRISSERCEKYRHEGKCDDKFYKMACGLTCHPFTCREYSFQFCLYGSNSSLQITFVCYFSLRQETYDPESHTDIMDKKTRKVHS